MLLEIAYSLGNYGTLAFRKIKCLQAIPAEEHFFRCRSSSFLRSVIPYRG
jgi:hypothetical protein